MWRGRARRAVGGRKADVLLANSRPRPFSRVAATSSAASLSVSLQAADRIVDCIWLILRWLESSSRASSRHRPKIEGKEVEMTMDVTRRLESGPYTESDPPKAPVKRSFDVAFLMAPDDTTKKRSQEALKEQLRLVTGGAALLYEEEKRYPELGLLMPKEDFPKSAFTKVAREQVTPPGPALSPELSSPGSISPNYYGKYMPKPYFREKSSPEEEKPAVSKRSPDVVPYGGLAMAYPFPAVIPPAPPALVTAALLPSSLAALTLPAQNVCAKCNISFRMTSDLVYHMRSQHKSDHTGMESRRRREQDKLRCPVCNETFRERHHLTRHMTAHQDKDGDQADDEEIEVRSRRLVK